MLRFSLLFGLGGLVFHHLAWLPGWLCLLAESLLLILVWRMVRLRPWLPALAGFVWAHGYALLHEPPPLPNDVAVLRAVIDAQLVSSIDRSGETARFIVETRRIGGDGMWRNRVWRFRLSWRNPPAIAPGDTWRLPVRLRAAHGYASPGAWDYAGWLYRQGVRYTGYVDPDRPAARLAAASCCWLTRTRAALSDAIDGLPSSAFARGVVRALVVGDAAGLSPQAKELFRSTGTSHLMAISGLHIGLVAGLGLVGVAWLWRRLPTLCGRVPARVAGATVALALAAGYAALAGMSLPTQRALIMLVVLFLGLLVRRQTDMLHALASAATGVLLWHPPSVLSAGFWLSFGAVLAILATLPHTACAPRWRAVVGIQLAIGIALWPVLASFGMPASGLAPLANLLLVPLFGLLVVPGSLLGVLLLAVTPALGRWALSGLATLLDLVEQVLAALAGLAWPGIGQAAPGPVEILLFGIAVALLLGPPGLPLRWLALPLLCLPWLPRAPALGAGEFEVHVLDVGQGLSVVVETRRSTLVFDTGPQFTSGFSTAEAVLVPFLARRGRGVVDHLVASHGDMDHAGGIGHLLDKVEVRRLLSGEPKRVGFGAGNCVAGDKWFADGVAFEFLHPGRATAASGNNASCVLRVSNLAGSILLTGDIEEPVERRLVLGVPGRLRSDLVVAPHHGSRSSSSAPFVAATSPRFVVYTAGWANRYGFPAAEVDRRWREAGAAALNTATLGTLRFRFGADRGAIRGPFSYRQRHRRFWWHDGGSAAPSLAVSSVDRPRRD